MDFQWHSFSPARRHLAHPLPMPPLFVCGPAERAAARCAHGPPPASVPACFPGCFRYWVGTMGFKIHLFFFLQGSSRGDEGVVDAFLALLPITWRSSRKPCTLPCCGGGRRSGAFRAGQGDTAGGHCRGHRLRDTARAPRPRQSLAAAPYPGNAAAGRGRGRARGSARAAPRLPRPAEPPRRAAGAVSRTDVPSWCSSPVLARAKHALDTDGFPRGGSAS